MGNDKADVETKIKSILGENRGRHKDGKAIRNSRPYSGAKKC